MGFTDIQKIYVDAGYSGFVDKIGPVDSDEIRLENGFPSGDGGYVPEASAVGRIDDGDVVIGLPRWVKEIGAFALVFGFLSMILGISQVLSYLRDTAATQSATSIGDLIPLRILFSGLKVTLIPTIYGSIIYLISLIVRVIQKPRL